jgi:hypothetical protein
MVFHFWYLKSSLFSDFSLERCKNLGTNAIWQCTVPKFEKAVLNCRDGSKMRENGR